LNTYVICFFLIAKFYFNELFFFFEFGKEKEDLLKNLNFYFLGTW